MVHDDKVCRLRLAPRLEHVTATKLRTLLPETVLAGRGRLQPHRVVVRYRLELADVAARGGPAPTLDPGEAARTRALKPRKLLAAKGDPEPVLAQVVGTTLEQRDLDRPAERLAHERQVAVVELVLQRPGSRRHDDPAPRVERGHEVGERLARAGAGLDHQRGAKVERLGHGIGHGELLAPGPEPGQRLGERPVGA